MKAKMEINQTQIETAIREYFASKFLGVGAVTVRATRSEPDRPYEGVTTTITATIEVELGEVIAQ